MRPNGALRLAKQLRWWILVLAVAGATAFVGTTASDDADRPLDPDSAARDGTKAMRLLVEELGGDFERRASPPDGDGVHLLMRDDLTETELREVGDWVRTGGRAVVFGATSPLVDGVGEGGSLGQVQGVAPECESPVVAGVESITSATSVFDLTLIPDATDVGCFPIYEDEYFMVEQRVGLGTVWALASPEPFTNNHLGEADNAVFVANLLDIRPGEQVVFSETSNETGGQKSLSDLVPDPIWAGIAQLAIAAAVLIAWRWRRLGRPVQEPMPVETPASALVVASGSMSERAGRHARAGALMRSDLRRLLVERLGLGRDAPDDLIIEVAAVRLGIERERLRECLAQHRVHDGKSLVKLAQRIESIHQEVAHGR